MAATVDFEEDTHDTFFYSYFPEMRCSVGCSWMWPDDLTDLCQHCAEIGMPTCDGPDGPMCCYGDELHPESPVALPTGRWFCIEMMLRANTPGAHDGVMAYWIDGELGHQVEDMMWRTIPELALNRVGLQHYITSSDAEGHSNRVWFDDVVVSTEPIGCD